MNAALIGPACALVLWQAAEAAAGAGSPLGARAPGTLPAARLAVADFIGTLRDAGAAQIGASVTHDVIARTLHVDERERWFPLSGPIQPPPVIVDPQPPAQRRGLEAYGRVRMLITDPERPQITFGFTAGGSVRVHPGDAIVPPRAPERFRFVRLERDTSGPFRVIYVRDGDAAEQTLVVPGRRAAGPEDPVRSLGPTVPAERPAGAAQEAPPPGLVERIGVVRSGNRRHVRMPRSAYDELRGPRGKRLLAEVKTREVRLPGGQAGLQLAWIGQKAQVLHKVKLQNGDVLVSVNAVSTPTRGALMQVVRALPEGVRRVSVEVDRNGRRLTYTLNVPAAAD